MYNQARKPGEEAIKEELGGVLLWGFLAAVVLYFSFHLMLLAYRGFEIIQ